MHAFFIALLTTVVSALSPVACTMDAKLCPDGETYVGREGPDCAFAACPGEEAPDTTCDPYVCADGTSIDRCTRDGHTIYYFAEPCLTHGGDACTASECGPAMGMPTTLCNDGTVAGPVCTRNAEGSCGWQVRECADAASFTDVSADHANAAAIAYVRAKGIVRGYDDGTYRPDRFINRAEFTKILIEAQSGLGVQALCKIAPFHDSDTGAWYAPYLQAARCTGIAGGYSDGTFRPAASINVAEAAKIIVKATGVEATTTIPACEGACPWYEGYVRMLEAHGAIPTSIASLDSLLTRGEMAEMLYRLTTGNADKPSHTYDGLAAPR